MKNLKVKPVKTKIQKRKALASEGKFLDVDGITVVDTGKWKEENERFYNLFAQLTDVEVINNNLTLELFAIRRRDVPNGVFWQEYQTPIRNQRSRNTCSGFAMVAAIEARYKRDYGLDLDLSEQFFWHSFKSTSLDLSRYKYENQSSFWGGGNSQGIREAVNFSICEERFLPYLDQSGMNAVKNRIPEAGSLNYIGDPMMNNVTQDEVDAFEYSELYIPQLARDRAKYGVKNYTLLTGAEAKNTDYLENIIASGHEVIIDIKLDWKAVPIRELQPDLELINNEIYDFDPDRTDGGGHSFLIVGYRRSSEVFFVKNSWGGDKYTMIKYDLVRQRASSAAFITEVDNPSTPDQKGKYLGRWRMNHDGWKGELIIRRYTNEENIVTRLGHYISTSDNKKFAVNGRFGSDNRKLIFSIEENEQASPDMLRGTRRFEMFIWSGHARIAAGKFTHSGKLYGAQIRRVEVSTPISRDFNETDWIGEWSMEHDGWRGILHVDEVNHNRIRARYLDSQGEWKATTGIIRNRNRHHALFAIRFSSRSSQLFNLFIHVWQKDQFSGYTIHNGKGYGVVGRKHP